MNNTKKNKMIAASVAGLLAMGTMAVVANAEMPAGGGVACYGINACKGTGECGGKGHACAGKNACKGAGFVKVETADACTAKDGKLTAPDAE